MADFPVNIQKLLQTESLGQIAHRMATAAVKTCEVGKCEKMTIEAIEDCFFDLLVFLKHMWMTVSEPSEN